MKTVTEFLPPLCVGISTVFALIHLSCYELPSDQEGLSTFETQNFTFRFDLEWTPPHEVSAYAVHAEQMLDYTLNYLEISLDDKILVDVGYVERGDYRSEKVMELSRTELEVYDPIPIARAVVSSYWDETRTYRRYDDFISAGLLHASSRRYPNNGDSPPLNPIDYFCAVVESLHTDPQTMPPLASSFRYEQEEIRFLCSARAGAFVHYVRQSYGISKVKELYEWSLRFPSRNPRTQFEALLSISFKEAEDSFYTVIGYPPKKEYQ